MNANERGNKRDVKSEQVNEPVYSGLVPRPPADAVVCTHLAVPLNMNQGDMHDHHHQSNHRYHTGPLTLNKPGGAHVCKYHSWCTIPISAIQGLKLIVGFVM